MYVSAVCLEETSGFLLLKHHALSKKNTWRENMDMVNKVRFSEIISHSEHTMD